MYESAFRKRDIFERAYGRYIVVVDGVYYELFFYYDDALKYKQAVLRVGVFAYIIDDNVENTLME